MYTDNHAKSLLPTLAITRGRPITISLSARVGRRSRVRLITAASRVLTPWYLSSAHAVWADFRAAHEVDERTSSSLFEPNIIVSYAKEIKCFTFYNIILCDSVTVLYINVIA